jgi:hypothetical protein
MVHHRKEPFSRPLELLHFRQQPRALLMVARIFGRRCRLRREQDREVLVILGEFLATGFFGQVEASENPTSTEDRDTKKRAHRRMMRRKSARFGVPGQIR